MCETLERSWSTHLITSVSASSGFEAFCLHKVLSAFTRALICNQMYQLSTHAGANIKNKRGKKKNTNLPTIYLIVTQYTT